ncbi:hypothetical protein Rs2_12128 [Raphanus sativus]|nr:hypothetical protein Rs2_12128 [Raphanus sativus]
MGAELHRDFVVCKFFGRIPAYSLIQNVLNYMWGKGKHLEIHMSPASNSVLVRIPNDYIKQKVLLKGYWYVDTTMFYVSQWTASSDKSAPSLKRVQLWAHLIDVPLDLIHKKGLSHIAGQIGEPKETDDWTLKLSSISVAHVKVEVDATAPLPKIVEVGRQDGSFVNVSVEYPWVPPICANCEEIGHISKNCPQLPPPPKPSATGSKQGQSTHTCYSCKEQGHLMKHCPKKSQEWILVKDKSKSTPKKNSKESPDASLPQNPADPHHPVEPIPPSIATSSTETPISPVKPVSPTSPADSPMPMAVENLPLAPSTIGMALGITDDDMMEAPCSPSSDFILALPAPHIPRPIIPASSAPLPILSPINTATSFNPFIPPPSDPLNPSSTQTTSPSPQLPQPDHTQSPPFSVIPTSNPFLPLAFEPLPTPPTSVPASPSSAQGKVDTPQ